MAVFTAVLTVISLVLIAALYYLVYKFEILGAGRNTNEGFTGQEGRNGGGATIPVTDQFTDLDVKLRDKIFGCEENKIYAFDVKQIAEKVVGDRDYKGLKILDAGTGIGRHYSEFSKALKGAEIVGVDRSANMIRHARLKNPEGNFINDDLLNSELFESDTFDYIFALLETLFYNRDVKKLVENFHKWLKPGGMLCVHLFNPEKLDPAPTPHTQYYDGDDGVRHALTYFNGFAHDAIWERKGGDESEYVQSFILDDGNKTTRRLKLYIPNQQQMIKMIQGIGFKVVDIISMRPLKIEDFELFCFQKLTYND